MPVPALWVSRISFPPVHWYPTKEPASVRSIPKSSVVRVMPLTVADPVRSLESTDEDMMPPEDASYVPATPPVIRVTASCSAIDRESVISRVV